MRLSWKKHKMRCPNPSCAKRTWVLTDHRIAAKSCLLTTRAAKWATVQVGTGRTVSEVAGELACDWHTVNDTVTTYGKALLQADRKRLNKCSLLELGDPNAEVAIAYRIKERLRDFYRTSDQDAARGLLVDLIHHCLKREMPPEIRRLGRTLSKWFDKICNYHLARVTNAPTEALNNLVKRIKRIGFGFRNFENYRIRALLYAGRPNWRVLGSMVVR